jgi:hypothetical protein
MLAEIRSQNSVCLHVRHGDYITDPRVNVVHGIVGLDYYQRAMENLRRRLSSPSFYIFSDDPDWARDQLRPPGLTTCVAHNLGKCDHEDLRLMRACRHFIIANSSFSWWGAWLSTSPQKVVIAPEKWLRASYYSPTDIVPESWIRL